ncbi:hypothetical protein C2S51_015065 [Perilla frutescens var. frutescens]|nr:hypothetical protein C2S51_015065 [Perilla frutescens var. frutescens]
MSAKTIRRYLPRPFPKEQCVWTVAHQPTPIKREVEVDRRAGFFFMEVTNSTP